MRGTTDGVTWLAVVEPDGAWQVISRFGDGTEIRLGSGTAPTTNKPPPQQPMRWLQEATVAVETATADMASTLAR